MQQGQIVLVDTNVIIEAVRTQCWSALRGYYRIETVEECIKEARSGNGYRPGYVKVTDEQLHDCVAARAVSYSELARLAIQEPHAESLDAGERHLWAHALTRQDAWVATTADAAAVRVAVDLGWAEQLLSLESLLLGCGAKAAERNLYKQFRHASLSRWRTQALLNRGS